MLSKEKKEETIYTTKKWVETIIIGLNLCPFAKAPFLNQSIRFVVADFANMEGFVRFFADELTFLDENSAIETTLIMAPALGKMEHFQAFFQFCEETIVLNEWTKQYQIVSFHPMMRFEGFDIDSPSHLTGMAPYPTIHVLRTPAVESIGATLKKDLQVENDKKLQKMTKEDISKLWSIVLK